MFRGQVLITMEIISIRNHPNYLLADILEIKITVKVAGFVKVEDLKLNIVIKMMVKDMFLFAFNYISII